MATLNLWYNFSKRKNSTKAPSGAADHSVDAKLKEETSLANPVFIVVGDLFAANYAQFAGMYYYVDDVVSIHNGLCEVHCSKDVLATYKSYIQAASAHVLFYNHANTEISDHRLSCKTTQTTDVNTATFGNFGSDSGYVITVVGKECIAAYGITESNLQGLIDQSFFTALDNNIDTITPVDDTGTTAETIADSIRWLTDLFKTEIGSFTYADNATANIRSCHILPISYAAIGGTVEQIYLGRMNTGKTALRITNRIYTDTATVNIPWQASDWRRNAPYHEIFLYIPCIGLTSISASDVIGETSLTVKVSMDKLSGDAIVTVSTSTKAIAYYTTNFSTPYPIGISQTTPLQASMAIGSAAAAIAASANPALTGAVAGLGLANAVKPNVQCIGSNTGGAILGVESNKVFCITVFHDTTVAPSAVRSIIGEPYNGVMSLSGISGYVQTAGASVDLPGFGSDKDQVNSFLNGGIYIE